MMKMLKQKKSRFEILSIYWNILMLVAFAILSLFIVVVVHAKLLKNAQDMGTILVRNYAANEQNHIVMYQTMMELGVQYIDEQSVEGSTQEEIQQWLYHFFTNVTKSLGSERVEPYAVVDGEIITIKEWEGFENYDFSHTQWYTKAIQANGEVIFTDAYQDVVTGETVITLAQQAKNSDSILVFDIFLENFHTNRNDLQLLQGSSYYVCGESGTLLYAYSQNGRTKQELESYVQELILQIQQGVHDDYRSYIVDIDGKKQGVYYVELQNGWISILTIPQSLILQDLAEFLNLFSLIFMAFLISLIFVGVRGHKMNKGIKRIKEAVYALGNQYYAIYRINVKHGTYQAIKVQPDIQGHILITGAYQDLLLALSHVVSKDVFQEFEKSFSLESIRQMITDENRGFGGDFLRNFGGIEKWVNVQVLFDESLEQDEVILCFRDIDKEKKERLEQLQLVQNALDSAKRSAEAKNIFFSNMSHDMRTPLNAIIGLSELAQRNGQDMKKISEYMRKITVAGKQLLGLINDVLEISRIERGTISLSYQEFDLQSCILDFTEIFSEQAEQEQKEFQVTFELEHRMVWGDSFRIGQILNNLISNAIKYSKKGDFIGVSVKELQNERNIKYEIVISDTGSGMSEEFLSRIFEPYMRETQFGAKNVAGTGLGMFIVKSLVQEMNGEITVESKLGQGSIFTVTLPLKVVEEQQNQKEQNTEQKQAFSLNGKKILLAEDNEINMEIAVTILSMNGLEVVQAWDGLQVVEQFENSQEGEFDAILMDMQMPNMNGCDAAKKIRSMERKDAKTIPIFAVTANAFAEDISMTTEAGMNAHISKPIDFNILCQTLEKFIQS